MPFPCSRCSEQYKEKRVDKTPASGRTVKTVLLRLPEHHDNRALAASDHHEALPNHQGRQDDHAKVQQLHEDLKRKRQCRKEMEEKKKERSELEGQSQCGEVDDEGSAEFPGSRRLGSTAEQKG